MTNLCLSIYIYKKKKIHIYLKLYINVFFFCLKPIVASLKFPMLADFFFFFLLETDLCTVSQLLKKV